MNDQYIKTIYVLPGKRISSMSKMQELLNDSVVISDQFKNKIIDIAKEIMIESYNVGKKVTPEIEKKWTDMERKISQVNFCASPEIPV